MRSAPAAAAIAAVPIGPDIITIAPATIIGAIVAVIIRAIAISAVIGDAIATNGATGGNDHEQAGKSGGR
jgi:hypothetical protein